MRKNVTLWFDEVIAVNGGTAGTMTAQVGNTAQSGGTYFVRTSGDAGEVHSSRVTV